MSAVEAIAAPLTRVAAVRRWAIGLVASIALAGGSAVLAADAPRTLHVAFPVAETGFDPQAIGDTYSDAVCLSIFDPLYRYDYFARPVVLEPNTADGPPEITDGGRTYTIKVKRGIFFAADPAFNGKKRELTAQDYVYSIKRVFDPKVRSYWLYIFEQTLVGLEGPLERARKIRQVRLRRKDRGSPGDRPLHAAHPLQAAGLRFQVVADDVELRSGRARGRREVSG